MQNNITPDKSENESILAISNPNDQRIFFPISLADKIIFSLIDSGSTCTHAGPDVIPLLGNLEPSKSSMVTANNHEINAIGEKKITFSTKGISFQSTVYAVKSLGYNLLLGLDFLEASKIIVNFANNSFRFPGGKTYIIVKPPNFRKEVDIHCSGNIACLSGKDPRYYFSLKIGNLSVLALVDSGSERSYGGKEIEKSLANFLKPVNATVMTADNSTETITGVAELNISLDKMTSPIMLRTVPALSYDAVLGVDFLRAFQIEIDFGNRAWRSGGGKFLPFQRNDSCRTFEANTAKPCAGLAEISFDQRKIIDEIVEEFVQPRGKILKQLNFGEHVIEIEKGHRPIRQGQRRYSPPILEAAQKAVDKLLEEDIIERCHSPWCSPPVVVPKKNNKYRFCIDYRKVNAITIQSGQLIPQVDSILDQLRNARYISSIDMEQAFHQIPVAEDSKDITAFSVQGRGQYRFKRMPYGLKRAPLTYQEYSERFIASLPAEVEGSVYSYFDDFLVVTETFEDHVRVLRIVLKAMRDANFQINLEKCKFCCRQIKYLGYVVDEKGLHVDEERVQAIRDYPAPTSLKQLRRFLGMVGWFSRFLEDFSKDKVPLCNLLKKDIQSMMMPLTKLKTILCRYQ